MFCAALVAVPSAQDEVKRKTVARDPAFTAAQAERGKKVYRGQLRQLPSPGPGRVRKPDRRGSRRAAGGHPVRPGFRRVESQRALQQDEARHAVGKAGHAHGSAVSRCGVVRAVAKQVSRGTAELTTDSATDIWIPGAGGAEGLQNYTYVSAVGCLHQDPTRSWLLTNAQELKKTDPPAAGAAPAAGPGRPKAPGEFTFRLLDAFNYNPEPHNGHKVRVTGYMVRLGAEIRVNVQALQMVSASCGN